MPPFTLPWRRPRSLTLLALELEEPFPHRPTSDVLCRRTGTTTKVPRLVAAASKPGLKAEAPIVGPLIDPSDQGGADAPRFGRSAAFRPGHLESYRNPLMTQRADAFRSGVATQVGTTAHPFARLPPRRPVKGPSVSTELDQTPALRLAASSPHRPEMLPANSYIPRCHR
jgi:hypothetical protein